jgi:hypothetical protein
VSEALSASALHDLFVCGLDLDVQIEDFRFELLGLLLQFDQALPHRLDRLLLGEAFGQRVGLGPDLGSLGLQTFSTLPQVHVEFGRPQTDGQ